MIFFPHLISAQIHATCDEDDWAIMEFMRRGSPAGWKRLEFTLRYSIFRKVLFGAHLFDAIIKNAARTLEVLRFEGDSYIGSKEIDKILCSAPKLKELSFSNKKMKRHGGWMDARAIVKSEWVCSGLEAFACRIGRIPRPDIMRNICGRASDSFVHRGSPKESVALQRLGDKEYYQQYSCLAMTLESGLDLLRGLKDLSVVGLEDLSVVGLEDMEVNIDDDKEQAWFARHWPHAVIRTDGYTTDRDNRA
ncbi:hypothetical protein BGW39_000341 [Mortierella sp. 14UC]|nr:hypothetical protein BGW39_000341 [Mortierella sp. 14UC]